MNKNKRQTIAYRILAFCLCVSMMGFPVYATSDIQNQIDEQEEEINKTETEIDKAEEQQTLLEEAKANMEVYLADLNKQYATISEELSALNEQITEKEEEIRITEEELEEAKEIEEQQYEDMKARMQYMYESPKESFFAILFSSGDFAEALNRITYVESLTTYDKEMFEAYQATKEEIAAKELQLQGEKEALDEIQAQVSEKRTEVSNIADNTKGEINQHLNEISEIEADISGKEDTLETQKEVLEELIAEKKRIEAEIEASKGNDITDSLGDVTGVRTTELEWVQHSAYPATEEEIMYLATIISCEAANQGDDGRLAVGATVMNRIRDGRFAQKDIISVIRAPGQFSPVTSGRFDLVLEQVKINKNYISEACFVAAERAIAGECNIGNRTFFRTYANYPSLSGLVINNHIFSYTWNYAS